MKVAKNTRENRGVNLLALFVSLFCLVACTRTCVGIPELGSKKRPVRFYLDGWNRSDESVLPFQNISACVEDRAGYRVSFEIAADEKAVASAVGRGEADLGLMTAFGSLESSESSQFQTLLVVTKRGEPSTRSVILGKTSRWRVALGSLNITLSANGLRSEQALTPINEARIVYVSPESDVGFIVPRHVLYQKNIFPDEAIFAGSFDLVLQSLSRDLAMAGAVSESYLEDKFPSAAPLQLGASVGEFSVLALSQGLPRKVIVGRNELNSHVVSSLSEALQQCSKEGSASDIQKVFEGDGFVKANDRIFDFLRELREFQKEFVRVLSPQQE